ncbi:MAG: hypothetical protein ACOC3T_00750 [Bacteroidota bacterium]
MANSYQEIQGDFRVVTDPVLREYDGKNVCIFHAVDLDIDTTDWTDNEILTRSKRIYEVGGHAKASETYLEIDSVCHITGTTGTKEAIDLNGNKYVQECVNSSHTQFKSFPKKGIPSSNQNLFDSL